MREVKNNNKWAQVFYSRWFLVVLFLLTILLVISYARAYYQEYQVRKQISDFQDELHSLQAKKIETIDMLKYAQSQSFVEEKARIELNMLKPGENEVVINSGTSFLSNRQEKVDMVKWTPVTNPVKWFKFYFLNTN